MTACRMLFPERIWRMANSKNNSGFIMQGSILAIASFVVRIIGLIYRIPLTNIIGDEGMGYYSYAYEPYSVMLMLSYHGIPAAVSKLVATNRSLGKFKNLKKIFWIALSITITIGCITGSILLFGAGYISTNITGQPMSRWAMMVLGPTLLVLSIMGVLRGFFQGMGTTMPTAISQVFEQIVNAVVSVVAAFYLFDYGAKYDAIVGTESYAEGYGAAGGTMGTFLGAVVALLFLIFIFSLFSTRLNAMARKDRGRSTETAGMIAKMIAVTAVPLIFNSILFNCNTTIDMVLFNKLMSAKEGYTEDGIASLWGMFTGKYKTMVMVPISIATALGVAIIPNFAEEAARGNVRTIRNKLHKAVRFGMIIAIPAAVGLSVLAEPVITMLFSGDNEIAVTLLRYGTIAVVIYSISTITNSALQGLDRERFTVISALFALIIHVIVLAICVGVLDMGIYGVLVAYVCFALVISLMNNFALSRVIGYRQEYVRSMLLPAVAAAVMGFAVHVAYKLIMNASEQKILSCLIAIAIGVIIYLVVLLLLRVIDENDVRSFPKGALLVGLFKKLHLLPR